MRWIIDGMNVIGSRPDGWWHDRRKAMTRLVYGLEGWALAENHYVTVVFESPPTPPIVSWVIEIAHAPQAAADSADDEIMRLVLADPDPAGLGVVTSDHKLAQRVRAAGASVFPAKRLRNSIAA
jgi:predicted RNA-binding protein with PIN domain